MAHTYKTTNPRHNAYQGLRFSVSSLTLAGVIGCFILNPILGLLAILPLMLLSGYINSSLNARATYLYLNRDCGVSVTPVEARKFNDYFSPNESGHWLPLDHLRSLPANQRRTAMLAAMAAFDVRRNQVADSPHPGSPKPSSQPPPSIPTPPAQPSAAAHILTVAEAQSIAVKRYPDLGIAGSKLNTAFVARYKLYQQTRPEYFLDTSWPLRLAEEFTHTSQRNEPIA